MLIRFWSLVYQTSILEVSRIDAEALHSIASVAGCYIIEGNPYISLNFSKMFCNAG